MKRFKIAGLSAVCTIALLSASASYAVSLTDCANYWKTKYSAKLISSQVCTLNKSRYAIQLLPVGAGAPMLIRTDVATCRQKYTGC